MVGGGTASAVSLTNESPTNGNYSYEGTGSGYGSPNDMAKHLLIATAHGDVPTIKLGMYFNTGGQKDVRIVNPALGDGGICRTNGTAGRPLSSDFVRVRIWEPRNEGNETVYNIRGSDVCNNEAANNVPSTANPKFFGTYQTPAPAIKDSDTSYYRLNIAISFINPGSIPRASGNDQAISFKVISPFRSLIGNIDTDQSTQAAPNNSTLAKEVGNPGGITHRFGFALPCRITESSNQRVTLYDADNGLQAGGKVRFYIATIRADGTENPLDEGQYGASSRVTQDNIGSIVAFRPDDDSEVTSWVTIKDMDPKKKYVLVVKNVHGSGRPDPSKPLAASNFIYVGMPGDSIFGAENFTCPGWDATPNTTVNNVGSVTAGETIRWTHTVKNLGKDNTTKPIAWEVHQTGVAPSTITTPGENPLAANKGVGQILRQQMSYKTKTTDAGRTVCQYIQIKPNALRDDKLVDEWELSTQKCVLIRPVGSGNFDPTVRVYPEVVEPNESYDEDSMVTGGNIPYAPELPRAEPTVQYQLGRVIYLPGSATFGGADTPPSCALYGQPNPAYCEVARWSGTVNKTTGVPYGTHDFNEPFPDNLPSGSKICYIMAVEQPPTVETHNYSLYLPTGELDEDDEPIYDWFSFSDRYYSDQGHNHHGSIAAIPRPWKYAIECVMVGKRPKVQVQGNDSRVRGESRTKVTRHNGNYYGSWVEYGAFSTKEDSAPASGAGYRNGHPADVNSRAQWSRLTFANTIDDQPNTYGYFTSLPLAPSIAAYYDQQTREASSWGGGALPGGMYQAGSISIGTSNDNDNRNLSKNRSTVVYSNGTVTINKDITYQNGGYSSFDDVPQVIIVAENINITSNVNRVDAWLIAYGNRTDKTRGNINTCSDGPPVSERRSSACNSPLVVNGPVIANGLYLNRTGPTTSDPTDAAEIFRLRPDAYLWAAARQKSTGAARTVDIVELPPRF